MITMMILWIIFSITEAYEDASYKPFKNHYPTTWPRIITIIMVTWLYCGDRWTIDYLSFAFILATVFWFVFELFTNIFRGNYLGYIGTTARMDQLLKRHELPIFFLRIFLIALSFCIYYYEQLSV